MEEFMTMSEVIGLLKKKLDEAINEKMYVVELNKDLFGSVDGYIDGKIVVNGAFELKCSFNTQGFICYHNDIVETLHLRDVMRKYEQKLCNEAFKLLPKGIDNEINKLEERIA